MDFTTRKDATLSTNRNRRAPGSPRADKPGTAQPEPLPERAIREALLDLAYDASSYLRRSARPAIRVSAALLVAASLAACRPTGGLLPNTSGVVQPLSREVRLGLPSAPGRYPIVPGTLGRDAQGVYYFAWQRPGDPPAVRNNASVSLLRLAQGSPAQLDVPTQGDPILYLPADASIPLVASADDLRTSVPSGGGGYYYWHPFYGGSYLGPAYYDPPVRSVPSSGSVDGARVSSVPVAPSERTIGVRGAVAARAGGAGSGTAATNKSGASASSIDHGGAAAAKSGGFSAGHASSGGGSSSS